MILREIKISLLNYINQPPKIHLYFEGDHALYCDSGIIPGTTIFYNLKGEVCGIKINNPYDITIEEWKDFKPLIPLELYEAMINWIRYKGF